MKVKVKSDTVRDSGTVGNWEVVEESDDYYKINRASEQNDDNPTGVSDTLLGKRSG